MPWNLPALTSSQVSNFKARLVAAGFDAVGRHYHKDVKSYFTADEIATVNEFAVGEHLFAALYFPESLGPITTTIEKRASGLDVPSMLPRLDEMLSDVVDDLVAEEVDLLGLTVTHVQLMASLAVVDRMKARRPDLVSIVGGLHLDEVYGAALLRHFPLLDLVCVGEGERPFLHVAELVQAGRREFDNVARVLHRVGGEVHFSGTQNEALTTLEDAPTPDISDFFAHALRDAAPTHAKVCVESARGCSWGKCTFCIEGIRRKDGYRIRSSESVLTTMLELSVQAQSVDFVFTDPDMSSRRDVFRALADSEFNFRLEAEVSGLVDLPTLLTMQDAGMRLVQIGIESFSPALLRRFAKGVRLIHYIELMRWCRTLGIELTYNIIVGAPFERQEDVDVAVQTMGKLWFLAAPVISEFVVSVGSPIHKNFQRFGIRSLSSLPETDCYPDPVREELAPLLSFHAGFAYEADGAELAEIEYDALVRMVDEWWDCAEKDAACEIFFGPGIVDVEFRVGDVIRHVRLSDPVEVGVLEVTRSFAVTEEELRDDLSGRLNRSVPDDELRVAIDRLIVAGVLFACDERFLTLPTVSRTMLLRDAGRRETQTSGPVTLDWPARR